MELCVGPVVDRGNGQGKVMTKNKQRGDGAGKSDSGGIVRDERGQDQPANKETAQRTADIFRDAAKTQPQSPGEPAGGE